MLGKPDGGVLVCNSSASTPTHVITQQPGRFLAVHDYGRRPGRRCSADSFRLKCAAYCATRAGFDGRRKEWCAEEVSREGGGGAVADEAGVRG